MHIRQWVVIFGAVLVMAALGFGAVLAAPRAQEAPPPEAPEHTDAPGRGFLGITIRPLNDKIREKLDLPDETAGVVVTHVLPNSPALEENVQPRDVITAVDGGPFTTLAELKRLMSEKQRGDLVSLTVLRDGEEHTISVTLGDVTRPHRLPSPAPRHRLPILGHGFAGLVDGEFRVLRDGVVVTLGVATGTVVSGDSGTLTIEKATPEPELVSFTITPEAKILNNGQAVEVSDLVGERVVVLERDGVVTVVAAGPARTPRHHKAAPPEGRRRHGHSHGAREHEQRQADGLQQRPDRLDRPVTLGRTQEA